MSTVSVTVVIYENEEEVDRLAIRYYGGQAYTVKIDTPDGTDVERERVAGNDVPA